jgi:alcohol dehydrogenase class IV
MNDLRKFVAPEFIFGKGALNLTGRYASNFGAEKVMVVSDEGVAKAGWFGKVCTSLSEAGVDYIEYLDIIPNPRDTQVMRGADIFLDRQCDAIVAVGGGSPMDCAKGIGIVATNGGRINEYEGADRVDCPIPPLICIPTTSGSSADVSQFSIITDTAKKKKMAIVSKSIVPDTALIDYSTLVTMDANLTMASGMDALVHSIEAYVSNAASPFTDLHAEEGIRLVSGTLIQSVKEPENLSHRERMMRGSLHAGLAFSNASLGAVHAMAHALGGLFDFPHGECNAKILKSVIEYNYEYAREKYDKAFTLLGMDGNESDPKGWICVRIDDFLKEGGLAPGFGEKPSEDTIRILTDNALADPCMATNPRKPDFDGIRNIYEQIFG